MSPRILLLTALLLPLTACKPDAALQKAEVIDRGTLPPTQRQPAPSPVPSPNTPTGTLTGTILFSGKPPAPVRIDTTMDPACNLSNKPVFSEQYAVTANKLANVFLYIANAPGAPTSTTPVVLDQRNCQYTPHVIALAPGGFVEFRNSDPTMHNIHTMPTDVGNQTIDISQSPHGAPITKRFDKPELMIPVRCNNHPWMNAFINVSPSPYFAVSATDGTFTIPNLPPGTYTLTAVHEKLGTKTTQITITPNHTTKSELAFALQK